MLRFWVVVSGCLFSQVVILGLVRRLAVAQEDTARLLSECRRLLGRMPQLPPEQLAQLVLSVHELRREVQFLRKDLLLQRNTPPSSRRPSSSTTGDANDPRASQ